jgi:glycosyltransferase involved in cell wall biosynthesis
MSSKKKEPPKLVRITTVPISLKVLLRGQMRFMKSKGFDVLMVSSKGPETASLVLQEECEHLSVTLTRKITPIQDLISLFKLTWLLIKIKPEIVHTHTPKAGLIGMWAAFFARVPVRLHTIAGLPWMESKGMLRKLLIQIEKITAYPAHTIFPNSKKQMEFMKQLGIAKNKMKVLGHGSSNGIDLDFFSKSQALIQQAQELKIKSQWKEEGWIWIFVGRVVKDKGISELLTAFKEIHARFPNDQLWHQGIVWWDYQQDVRPFLLASDVLVFPSYREGFPNVPLQAAALDCMLILSDINGCNEIVDDGINGILVQVKSAESLTKAMLSTRNDPEKKSEMAEKIREKVTQYYDQKKLWNLLLEEYRAKINR